MQCGGLWFVNGKISITWNLKQAIVQKPKQTLEGVCFLRPKESDKEILKALPPPEDEYMDGTSTTIVDDDEEPSSTYTYVPIQPMTATQPPVTQPATITTQPVTVPVDEPVSTSTEHAQEKEADKPKKKIMKKKLDA
jgi:hypothetical protein